MRDGGRLKSSPGDTDRDITMTKGGHGTTIVQSFGKESNGADMRGTDQASQRRGTLNGGIRDISHSITGASVTGVPTAHAPHKTRTAV